MYQYLTVMDAILGCMRMIELYYLKFPSNARAIKCAGSDWCPRRSELPSHRAYIFQQDNPAHSQLLPEPAPRLSSPPWRYRWQGTWPFKRIYPRFALDRTCKRLHRPAGGRLQFSWPYQPA